jgi:enoyl-[acyl-carrier protein] reductase I
MPTTLLEGKRLLLTGVLTPASIAFSVAQVAQEEGAELVLTGFGKSMSLTERSAKRLPRPVDVLELDANDDEHIERLAADLRARWGGLDGILHAIAFAPQDALGGNFLHTPRESAETAFRTSAFSLKALAAGLYDLMRERGGSIVSMDFDATVAWPIYDWMGVAKAALESVTRYLARDLGPDGIRVNCISAGPLRTMAAKSIPGFDVLARAWSRRAPLRWDTADPLPVARAVSFLLSDWSAGITGEIVHVDGGYHAMGADLGGESPPEDGPSEGLPESDAPRE